MKYKSIKSNREYFYNFGMDEDIVDEVKKRLSYIKESGYFKGENDIKIYYEKYKAKNQIGKIVISHGFTECIEKYREIIYYFIKEGYSVFIMEHRGHGRSGRLGKKHESQINIEDFNYYVNDFKVFIDKIVIKNTDKIYLYGERMKKALETVQKKEKITHFTEKEEIKKIILKEQKKTSVLLKGSRGMKLEEIIE